MSSISTRNITFIFLALVGLGGVASILLLHSPTHSPTAIASTTKPTTQPATTQVTRHQAPRDFMALVRDAYPDFPATQPFDIPVELHEAARLLLDDPIYLDSAQELWITRADAQPTLMVLKKAADEQVHLTREHVVYLHRALDDAGQWQPQLICRQSDGSYVLIAGELRQNLGSAYSYHWDRAFDWNSNTNEGFVVPTDSGVSVFRPRSLPVELHYDFAPSVPSTQSASVAAGAFAEPQMLLDSRGLLAWIPWENNRAGSHGAARFVDGHWTPLGPAQNWPDKILHLVPLLDGSVIQLVSADDETVTESLAQLDAVDVDRTIIDPLIAQLSDPEPKKRDDAYAELTRYGSGLWPVLEKVIDDQPPEGRQRIEQLLAGKLKPTLGAMTLLPGKCWMISRFNDGGALLFAESGVSVPNKNAQQPDTVTAPAYISIRPGRPVEPASPFLVQDLPPDAHVDVAPDEWIVTDAAHGPRRLLGNHLEPLLRKSERAFSQFVGIDRRGRWLFRKPGASTPTLLLDPTLPDVTPRLAAWVDPVACDVAGWDDGDWPVVVKNDNAWSLHEADWVPLPAVDKGRRFFKSVDEMPRATPAQAATAQATTSPAVTQPTTAAISPPPLILTETDGTRYFDGTSALHVIKPDGTTIDWSLPASATGNGEVHLVRAGDRLFLFNQPGRVLRILPTPGRAEPFKIEATFTDRIPNADHYSRIWLDPAGRLDLIFGGRHLVMLFPDGHIPRPIAEKMPAEQLKNDDD